MGSAVDQRKFVTSIAQAILIGWIRRDGPRRGDSYFAFLRAVDIAHKIPGLFVTGTIRIDDA